MYDIKATCHICKAKAMCQVPHAIGYCTRDLEGLWLKEDGMKPFQWPDGEPLTYEGLRQSLLVDVAALCTLFQADTC